MRRTVPSIDVTYLFILFMYIPFCILRVYIDGLHDLKLNRQGTNIPISRRSHCPVGNLESESIKICKPQRFNSKGVLD